MKKLFDEELSFVDIKDCIKNMRKKQKNKKACLLVASIFVVLATLGAILLILKFKKNCPLCNDMDDFDGFGIDGSGVYATDSDFE